MTNFDDYVEKQIAEGSLTKKDLENADKELDKWIKEYQRNKRGKL